MRQTYFYQPVLLDLLRSIEDLTQNLREILEGYCSVWRRVLRPEYHSPNRVQLEAITRKLFGQAKRTEKIQTRQKHTFSGGRRQDEGEPTMRGAPCHFRIGFENIMNNQTSTFISRLGEGTAVQAPEERNQKQNVMILSKNLTFKERLSPEIIASPNARKNPIRSNNISSPGGRRQDEGEPNTARSA